MNSELADFQPFPKMPRLSRDVVVTEKIDGTNAQISIRNAIDEDGLPEQADPVFDSFVPNDNGGLYIRAASRMRWLTRGGKGDNFNFGEWVAQHADELSGLGVGRHFGEWWGMGIQRRYGLSSERRFSLFNIGRWGDVYGTNRRISEYDDELPRAPACCYVVPVLYRGNFDELNLHQVIAGLKDLGSAAAPGFMEPEGIVLYHEAARQGFKKLLVNDDQPKSLTGG